MILNNKMNGWWKQQVINKKEFREDREIQELKKDISDSFQTGKMWVNSEQ